MEILKHLNKVKKPVHFMVFLEKLVAQFKPLQVYQYAQLGQQVLSKMMAKRGYPRLRCNAAK